MTVPKESSSELSYEAKTIIVVLLLLFVTPAGLLLMWVWMKWPVWVKILLTVLPFLFMFLIFAFVGWIMYIIFSNPDVQKQIQTSSSAEVTKTQVAMQVTPQQLTQNFYDHYINCLNKPGPKTSVSSCTDESILMLTPQLLQKFEKVRGYDPIVCAQNIPAHAYVKQSTVTNDKADIMVSEDFVNKVDISVQLIKVDDSWKINDITCPRF